MLSHVSMSAVQVARENTDLANELSAEKQALDAAVQSVRVSITSAASSLAYHVISMIASHQVFGSGVKVNFDLCDTNTSALSTVALETIDLASGSVHEPPAVTSDPTQFFTCADVILLLDDVVMGEGEARSDWLSRVYSKFSCYAQQIDAVCRREVVVIVPAVNSAANLIGNIISRCAPNIPAQNIIVTSRLVENRAKAAIVRQSGVNCGSIVDLIVWGDSSAASTSRFVVDVSHAKVYDCESSAVWGPEYLRTVDDVVHDKQWLCSRLPDTVSSSSSSSSSSVVSAASALTSFLSDWWLANCNSQRIHSLSIKSQGKSVNICICPVSIA